MNVIMFSMLEERKKLNKRNYIQVGAVDFKLEQDCSILKPVLYIKKESFPNYVKANYCYISEWGRYYFIDDPVTCKGGFLQIQCSVDVMNTYKNEINGITTLIDRQENIKNMSISDNEFLANNKRDIVYKSFGGSVFSAGNMADGVNCIALTVTGGDL